MMTDTVCAESPVSRAISALASDPLRRSRVSTSRSFWARMPLWLVPRSVPERSPGSVSVCGLTRLSLRRARILSRDGELVNYNSL